MSTPIEDYALLGDGESAALVSRAGSVDWLCWPRFDSDACFAALLGRPEHGAWRIAAPGGAAATPAGRRYVPGSLVLETDLDLPGGRVRLTDFMPMRNGPATFIRLVEALEGTPSLCMDLGLRFGYGLIPPWTELTAEGFEARIGPDRVTFTTPVPVILGEHAARVELSPRPGQRLAFVLRHTDSSAPLPGECDPEAALAATLAHWQGWSAGFDRSRTRWPDAVSRSLITLKALSHQRTGAIIAAPTTSLPEQPGGTLNWDYRYCWLRDATFTLSALLNAGYHEEAERWRGWLLRAIGGSPELMRIAYRADGGRDLQERTADWLPGYRHARPVRIGNQAAGQFQGDVWGEVLDCLHLAERAGLPPSAQARSVMARLAEHLSQVWDRPGAGLWESRSEPRRYTYSGAMAWAGLDRALRSGAVPEGKRGRMSELRDRIHREVCEEGFNAAIGSFTDFFGGHSLDASVLLLPLVGFLPATDPRMAATIATVGRELEQGGLIRRNKPSQDPPEGAFLACSCWMADCLNLLGRKEEASAQLERVLALQNDVGLLSEEYDVTGQCLAGNFPQALTHLAVVNTALGLCGPVLNRGGG